MGKKLMQKEVTELTGFTGAKIKRLVKHKKIDFDGKYYDADSINAHVEFEKNVKKNYYTFDEFKMEAEIPKSYDNLTSMEPYYPNEAFKHLKILKIEVGIGYNNVFIEKESVEVFKEGLCQLEGDRRKKYYLQKELTDTTRWGHGRIKWYENKKLLNPVEDKSGRVLLYPISEVNKIVEEEGKIKENYYPFRKAQELLGFSKGSRVIMMKLVEAGELEYLDTEIKIAGDSITWISKSSVRKFIQKIKEDYIDTAEIARKLRLSLGYVRQKFSVEDKFQYKHQILVKRVVAARFISLSDDYCTLHEIGAMFAKEKGSLEGLVQNGKLLELFKKYKKPEENNGVWLFSKLEVEEYFAQIEDLKKSYFTRPQLFEYLGLKETPQIIPIKKIEMPEFMKILTPQTSQFTKYLYERKDAKRYKENEDYKLVLEGVQFVDESDYFKEIMKTKAVPGHLSVTMGYFISYAEKMVTYSEDSNKLSKIKDLSNLVQHLLDIQMAKELHRLSDAEFKNLLESCPIKSLKEQLWNVAKHVEERRLTLYKTLNHTSPYSKSIQKKKKKEVLEFEQLLAIYKHCKNGKHIENAIKDKQYASIWLFTMILLTNAWRPGDVYRVPPISPELIGINDIKELRYKEITVPHGQRIINILHSMKLVTAKNGMPRNFTCNPDLVPSMVTAMCICEFHRRKSNMSTLIDFTHEKKKQNKIRTKHFEKFLETGEKTAGIKFNGLIANRSLLEHLYYSIQEKKGKGNSAFELVMKFRAHKTDVTKEYIGSGDMSIARELFWRGEFGYIYDQMVSLLTNNQEQSITEKTKQIKMVKAFFGPGELENLVDFQARIINEEEQTFLDALLSSTPEEIFERTRAIYLGEIPAKNPDVQCLIYPECHRLSNKYSCNTCPFAVHNVYALESLFVEYKDSLRKYKATTKKGAKKREEQIILKIQDALMVAIDKFGEEYVFSFYPGGEEKFEKELMMLGGI
ncbi:MULTISPECIES: hypothetical protein [Bacillus cereus group]|uniref:hypothetical protein n=1 Tax=Bacillus cereus group TaxID=86661 RepID=UPI00119CF69A|nr:MULTISPECIES: hypothetical protein [Bacillus cereus group]